MSHRRRPSVAIVALATGAGLLTGLLRFGTPGSVGMLLGLAFVLRRRTPAASLVAAVLAVGILSGLLALRRADAECGSRLRPGPVRLTLRVIDGGQDGGVVRPHEAGCRGTIRVRWPLRGTAPPVGSLVEGQGRWIAPLGPRPGILLLRRVRDERPPRRPLGARTQERLRHTIAAQYGPRRAPLVEAMVLGRRTDLDPALRDLFAASGLAHLLAISGFHVGLVAGWVLLLLRLLRIPVPWAWGGAGLVALGYAAALGWPVPATRAAIMASCAAWARVRQRRVRPAGVLGTSAILILWFQPEAIRSPGAWLSFAAVWGTVYALRWCRDSGFQGTVTQLLASSVGATLATAPVTAAVFGSVAPIGVALNLVAIPLAAAMIPGILGGLVLAPLLPAVATRLSAGAGALLDLLSRLATIGAGVPSGQWVMEPGPAAAVGPLVALGLALWVTGGGVVRRREAARRGLWVVTGIARAFLLASAGRSAGHEPGTLALHFLDVGQGDAALIRTPAGRWVLVDAGPRSPRWDAGRRVVAPFLRRQGVGHLAGVVVSHAHLDHLGGVPVVLDQFRPGWLMEPTVPVPDTVYRHLLDQVEQLGIPLLAARSGEEWEMDGVRWRVLHPDTTRRAWGLDLNEDSAVLLVEYGAFRAVLSGDAGAPAEEHLAGTVGRVDVLKVGHHGSRSATGPDWLAELEPRVAVISLGANGFGHPAPETLARLAIARADIWRTDREGTITVLTDGRSVTVTAQDRHLRFAAGCRHAHQEQSPC